MRKKVPDLNKGSCSLREPTEQGPGGKLYVHSLPHALWLPTAGRWGLGWMQQAAPAQPAPPRGGSQDLRGLH